MTVPSTLQLTSAEFKRMQKMVYDMAGIAISDEKVAMLSNRLRKRLKALNLETFREYCDVISKCEPEDEEISHFLSAVSTNETYFFRNDRLWQYVGKDVIQHLCKVNEGKSPKRAAFWSAASSTGAEAYTLAMVLKKKLPQFNQWRVHIIGTDISQKVLDIAKKGLFAEYAVNKMKDDERKRYFKHNQEDNTFQLKDDIRKMVEFQFLNLRDSFKRCYFDVVFLRNVMMYFDYAMKKKVLENVYNAMKPGAIMITGDVDPLRDGSDLRENSGLEFLCSNTYCKPVGSAKPVAVNQGG